MEVLGGIGKDIAGGINNAIAGWANKNEEARNREAARRNYARNTDTLVDLFCAGDWDGVLNFTGLCHYKERALRIMAHAKKGECLVALKEYFSYLDFEPADKYEEREVEEYFSEKTKKFFIETGNLASVQRALIQAYSKEKGHQVTKDDLKQFYISSIEKAICSFSDYKNRSGIWGEIDNWSKRSGREMTVEDIRRISGGNEELVKCFLFVEKAKADTEKSSKVSEKVSKIIKFIIFGTIAFFVIQFIIRLVIAMLGEL
jgi:hypothetical protein